MFSDSNTMRSLDLFCGTKSFSKIASAKGYETHTLDILEKFNPTYLPVAGFSKYQYFGL